MAIALVYPALSLSLGGVALFMFLVRLACFRAFVDQWNFERRHRSMVKAKACRWVIYVQFFGTATCLAVALALMLASLLAVRLRTQPRGDTVRGLIIPMYLCVFVVPLVYYLWLCSRERSLQCVFFHTPKPLLFLLWFMIGAQVAVMLFVLVCHHNDSPWKAEGTVLLVGLDAVIVLIGQFMFFRVFLATRSSGGRSRTWSRPNQQTTSNALWNRGNSGSSSNSSSPPDGGGGSSGGGSSSSNNSASSGSSSRPFAPSLPLAPDPPPAHPIVTRIFLRTALGAAMYEATGLAFGISYVLRFSSPFGQEQHPAVGDLWFGFLVAWLFAVALGVGVSHRDDVTVRRWLFSVRESTSDENSPSLSEYFACACCYCLCPCISGCCVETGESEAARLTRASEYFSEGSIYPADPDLLGGVDSFRMPSSIRPILTRTAAEEERMSLFFVEREAMSFVLDRVNPSQAQRSALALASGVSKAPSGRVGGRATSGTGGDGKQPSLRQPQPPSNRAAPNLQPLGIL